MRLLLPAILSCLLGASLFVGGMFAGMSREKGKTIEKLEVFVPTTTTITKTIVTPDKKALKPRTETSESEREQTSTVVTHEYTYVPAAPAVSPKNTTAYVPPNLNPLTVSLMAGMSDHPYAGVQAQYRFDDHLTSGLFFMTNSYTRIVGVTVGVNF